MPVGCGRCCTAAANRSASPDLIGPPAPVYLAGAEVVEVFPVLPLMGNVTLGVGALSYAGQFTITLIADRDTYPDLDALVGGIEEDLVRLGGAVCRVPLYLVRR
jgi:hypothetical protein